MNKVEGNRSYIKGGGACVNVDESAYRARLARKASVAAKDKQVQTLQNEVSELKQLVTQLLQAGK